MRTWRNAMSGALLLSFIVAIALVFGPPATTYAAGDAVAINEDGTELIKFVPVKFVPDDEASRTNEFEEGYVPVKFVPLELIPPIWVDDTYFLSNRVTLLLFVVETKQPIYPQLTRLLMVGNGIILYRKDKYKIRVFELYHISE